ncbi:MAG: transcriptional regulator MntR [Verrucomicrobia bacterium]|nr:MAG: transcriptional regulator MntR [Verrucomicrobiota bacterium]
MSSPSGKNLQNHKASVGRKPLLRTKSVEQRARTVAAGQRRTRQQHAQERAEDYVEAIAELIDSVGEARATDIAKRMGVSHVTVIQTVRRLRIKGLLQSEPYRSIFLTPEGRAMASASRKRHKIVVNFLCALGISEAVAQQDAEGIEHHCSKETLRAFERFLAESHPNHLRSG